MHRATLSSSSFRYGEKLVEVVKSFTYLGVTFCTCGKFHEHVKMVKAKCAAATRTLISIISRSRTNCWQSMMRLKDSMLLSIALYASDIWGLNEAAEIEKIQNTFVRRLLHLPANSPGYLLRIETGMLPITYHILRRVLFWLTKVQAHDETRLTKIWLQELIRLDSVQSKPTPYNWYSRVKQEILDLKIPYVKDKSALFSWEYLNLGDLVSMHVHKSELADVERCENSSYSSFYHKMKAMHAAEPYLSFKLSLQYKRTFCNLRLHVDRLPFLNIYINHQSYKLTPTLKCPICGKDNDDMFHALVKCIHYECIRPENFSRVLTTLHTHMLFRSYDIDSVKTAGDFLMTLLKRRQFLLGE